MHDIKQLYLQHQKDVYFYLLSLTRNATLAEDLCSETFLKALQNILNFKGQSSIKTWLFGIARNLWLQSLREVKPLCYEDFISYYLWYDEEDIIEKTDLAQYIITLLSQKDENTKQIVLMRIDGYSYKEIAQKINISEGSARVIDHRARQWIIDKLRKENTL